ncbi:MAG: acyl-CoA thioesterase II [Arcanobacterium sp.]|nr:acyl-CoA thioesterase II [Arcanobacterium sp.]
MSTQIQIPLVNTEPLQSILGVLQLEKIDQNLFRGKNLRQFGERVYGGQVFAQAVMAAQATLQGSQRDDLVNREIHSITAAFLRPGKLEEPTNFLVEDVLDGKSFSTRRVYALQNNETIFSARASFQIPQTGVDHQSIAPEVTPPEELNSSIDFFAGLDMPGIREISMFNAVDLRHVNGAIWIKPEKTKNTRTQIWFKFQSPLPEETPQVVHRALLAYATDQFMLEPVLRAHGLFWLQPKVNLATLDHSIWWHRNVDVSDWILADLESPSAQGGRGLAIAKYFQNGKHIATMAQEGMVRS